MKFVIDRTYFLDALKKVQPAVATKTPYEALKYMKVIVGEEGITLMGSNSDLTLRYFLPFEQHETQMMRLDLDGLKEIEFLFDARPVIQSLSKLKPNNIEFKFLEDEPPFSRLEMKAGRSKTILSLAEPRIYPDIKFILDDSSFEMTSDTFKKLMHGGGYATSMSEVRPICTGIHLFYRQNCLYSESTDSFHAGRYIHELDAFQEIDEDLALDVTLERNAVTLISSMLPKEETPVRLNIQPNQVMIQFNRLTLTSRLLSGIFPSLDQFIDVYGNSSATCEVDPLLEVTERMLGLSKYDDSTTSTIMIMTINNDNANELKLGTGKGTLMTEDYVELVKKENFKNNLQIAINPSYLINVLKSFKTLGVEVVKLGFNGDLRPIVIRNEKDDDSHTALIVPLRMS